MTIKGKADVAKTSLAPFPCAPTRVQQADLPVFELRRRRELAGSDCAQQRPQLGGALIAEPCFEARLRLCPCPEPGLEPLLADLGQVKLFCAPVGWCRFDPDQPVSLQRLDVTPECRAIHDHLIGKGVDRERSSALELRQDGELGGAQPGGRQELIIELGAVASGGADGEAVAILRSWQAYGLHLSSSGIEQRCICSYIHVYAHMSMACQFKTVVLLQHIRERTGTTETMAGSRTSARPPSSSLV